MIHLIKPLEFDRSWQDAFGTILASVERGSRKWTVMVITSSELSQITLDALTDTTFQGRIVLAILEHLHCAPLEAVLRGQEPNFVIALKQTQTGIATHGPVIHGEARLEIASTGLEYAEPGAYTAWTNSNTLTTDPQASSAIASVASDLGLPCLVCNPSDLKTALELAFQK
jgi:hypothetical protein